MTEPRPLLGGRYSLERPVTSTPDGQSWMAIEAVSGRLVVVAVAEPGRLSTLVPARDVRHRHLATVIDIVKEVGPESFPPEVKLPVGAGAAVAEHVPGRTLRAVLEAGPLHPAKAVAWVLRLADAVQALHAAGAVHGGISPRSIIAEPEGRAIAPVLSQLIAPPIGAFCPPERLRGGAEGGSDDVWALTSTLYAALTGKPPYFATTRDGLLRAMTSRPEPLLASGVDEPVLQEIIARGLVPERRPRASDLAELQALLDAWERDPTKLPPPRSPPRPAPRGLGEIVSGAAFGMTRDDGIVADDSDLDDDQGGTLPPPPVESARYAAFSEPPAARAVLPFGAAPVAPVAFDAPAPRAPAPRRVSFNPFERKRTVWPWLLVAAGTGGAGVYLTLSPDSKPPALASASAVDTPPPAAPAPKPPPQKNPALVRNQCVAEHFPPDSFDGLPDFAFVCEDGDFPAIARRLSDMVVLRDPATLPDAGGATDGGMSLDVVRLSGMRVADGGVGSGLGWYELPATAIIRKACCSDASPVVAPETPGWCEQLQSVLRRMADDSAKSMDLAPAGRAYYRAVNCLVANHVRHPYTYSGAPDAASRAAFQQFLGRAAIISARR